MVSLRYGLRDVVRVDLVNFDHVIEDRLEVVQVDGSYTVCHSLVRFDHLVDELDLGGDHKLVHVCVRGLKNLLEVGVRVLKKIVDEQNLLLGVRFRANHPSQSFVHDELLMGLKVFEVRGNLADELINVGFLLLVVLVNKHVLRQLGYLKESLTRHVLDSGMLLMHEFVQLLDDCLKECPVRDEEVGELANNVHDVSRNLSFRVLSVGVLAEVEQLFNHSNHKLIFVVFLHAAGDGAKSPAKFVQVLE